MRSVLSLCLNDYLETKCLKLYCNSQGHYYNSLKQELNKVYGLTDKQKKWLLLSLFGLGGKKPSERLHYMKALHRTDLVDPLFTAFFMQQPPASVCSILAVQDFTNVYKLADAADEVLLEQSKDVVRSIQPLSQPSTSKQVNLYRKELFVSIINAGVPKPISVKHPGHGRETRQTATNGGRCSWLQTLPTLCMG